MVFQDIIALAKAGYTPADVREFLAAETEPKKEAPSDGSAKETPGEKTDTENTDVSRETSKEHTDLEKPTEKAEGAIDYKAQYEAAMEALKNAQAANTKQQQPPKEDDQKTFYSAVAEFM